MSALAETPRAAFQRRRPDFPLLGIDRPAETESFLRARGWIERGERFLGAERAGEGNMNLTLRVRTDRRSLVLKQSRPWVEKYDAIEAPFDRAVVERRFYERVAHIAPVAATMPRLLAADDEARALLLEDLAAGDRAAGDRAAGIRAGGEGGPADYTGIYDGSAQLGFDEIETLADFLAVLHRETRGGFAEALANREMRALNHEHLFRVPLRPDNGVPLEDFEPGLSRAAAPLRDDPELGRRCEELGERYLADGPCLVHGDFFPGSWLRTPEGPRVIDPEFGFFGDPELDVAVALAHLAMAAPGALPAPLEVTAARLIERAGGRSLDRVRLAEMAGVEVIRRTIGVAQLPIPRSRGRRARLLSLAHRAVLEGRFEGLVS